MVWVRMTTNSTAARAGQVVERQEAEAKRLIAAGYAEPYAPVEYVSRDEFTALAERVTQLEGSKNNSNEKGGGGKEK